MLGSAIGKLLATPRRLEMLAGVEIAGATLAFSYSEHASVGRSMWWAVITLTTVGYGDQYPHHALGQIAGAILALTMVFVVIPCLTARIVARHVGDGKHLFSDEEQRECFRLLYKIAQEEANERHVA